MSTSQFVPCNGLPIAAGHDCSIRVQTPADGGKDMDSKTILKPLDQNESETYSRLFSSSRAHDPVLRFVPAFGGALKLDQDTCTKEYLVLGNVLQDFVQPMVMDVKLGLRTFLESECQNDKPRPDLFEKMAKMYPSELSEQERAAGFITKHRWMTVRDKNSTIKKLGFRVEGIAGDLNRRKEDVDADLKKLRTNDDTRESFGAFAQAAASNVVSDDQVLPQGAARSGRQRALHIAESICGQLKGMRLAMETSPFVEGHELIGTSTLLVADATGRCGVFWIDFAKVRSHGEGAEPSSHRKPWVPGNGEDGVFIGLDNMITQWQELATKLSDEVQSETCDVAMSSTAAAWRRRHGVRRGMTGKHVVSKTRGFCKRIFTPSLYRHAWGRTQMATE